MLNCVVWTRPYWTILVNEQYFIFKRLENLTLTLNLFYNLTLQEILLSDNQRQITFGIGFSSRTNLINNCTLNSRCKNFNCHLGQLWWMSTRKQLFEFVKTISIDLNIIRLRWKTVILCRTGSEQKKQKHFCLSIFTFLFVMISERVFFFFRRNRSTIQMRRF